jgi:hypothetical protein
MLKPPEFNGGLLPDALEHNIKAPMHLD